MSNTLFLIALALCLIPAGIVASGYVYARIFPDKAQTMLNNREDTNE